MLSLESVFEMCLCLSLSMAGMWEETHLKPTQPWPEAQPSNFHELWWRSTCNCGLASDQHSAGSLDVSQEAKPPPQRSARSCRLLTQHRVLAGVVALQNVLVFPICTVPFALPLAAKADVRQWGKGVGFQLSVQWCRNATTKKTCRTINFFFFFFSF